MAVRTYPVSSEGRSTIEDTSPYITVKQAQDILGVSKAKMSQLIRDGLLEARVSAFDKRYKMILRADVEKLAQQPRPEKSRRTD